MDKPVLVACPESENESSFNYGANEQRDADLKWFVEFLRKNESKRKDVDSVAIIIARKDWQELKELGDE